MAKKKNTCNYMKRKEVDNFLLSTALAFNTEGVATGYNKDYDDEIIMARFNISRSTIRGLRHDVYNLYTNKAKIRGKGTNTIKINDLEERVASVEIQLAVLHEHQHRFDFKVAS